MDTFKGGNSPSSEALLPITAGEKTASVDNRQRPALARRMACARRTIIILSLGTLVLLWFASVGSIRMPCHKVNPGNQTAGEVLDSSSFSAMLESASPASLQDLLHRYFPEKFPHGVFPSAHETAAVQQAADAPVATSNVQLAKRQNDNSTTSSASATPTSTPTETSTPPAETTSSTTVVPPPSSSSSTRSSTSAAPPPSTSSVPPATTSRSKTTLTTSTVPPPTTTAPTSTRASTSKAIVETFTSTHPNGAVVTITTTTFVPADEEPSATSTRPVPTLQNFAVRPCGSGPALAGAVGAAMLFLAA
ncbi:hypothetical protein NEMBOFW57_005901 [Staphylotrichum longicolle]|uniref:Uncharacterized protein n=1 Tax=Staphylotrichum longicolle TaxID=669026 RepID=A0AAD4I0R0_9PEZI|nr:hypothetical protein NEMBOFW57_005901 [Staphylotrichum longicolle]